jgi:LacI family transcriptional regulator
MREVAALAGTSLKTVSRVVNNEPGVTADLADRVQQAIVRLNYRHNTTASSLRRTDRRTATIGLLLEDVSNPFSSAINRAIEDVASERRTLVFAGSSDGDRQREINFVRALASRQVDGLIIVPVAPDQRALLNEHRLGLPMVFVDRIAVTQEIDSVTADNRAGARLAVHHLADHGHRRIAFLGDQRSIWTAEERYLGYIEGLATEGIRLVPRLVRRDVRGAAAALETATQLLLGTEPPSAFFCSQNLLTIGVVRALQRVGAQRRIALVGFDDFPLADLLDPPVSVIAQDPAGIGRAAAARLFERLDGDESSARHDTIATRLVPRGSGEIRASSAADR